MAVPVVGTNSLNTYIFLVFLIMIKSNYHVDMSQFGKILVEVMSKYHITSSSLYHTTGVSKEYISAVWGGQADYHHSIYVRIVDGLPVIKSPHIIYPKIIYINAQLQFLTNSLKYRITKTYNLL